MSYNNRNVSPLKISKKSYDKANTKMRAEHKAETGKTTRVLACSSSQAPRLISSPLSLRGTQYCGPAGPAMGVHGVQ